MSMILWRRLWVIVGLAVCGAIVEIGCDGGESDFRPPTAAVNGDANKQAEPASHSANDVSALAVSSAGELVAPVFDPHRPDGTFFDGWPKPKLALVISGRQDGYLEPCGCAGLENQKGGIGRRHALFKEMQEKGWPVAAVDVGGLVRRFGKQAEVQLGISADALKTMGYGAVGFGPADLRLSAGDIVAAVAGADSTDGIFVAANVNLLNFIPKTRIIKAGGMTLGVTSVLGKEFQQQVNNGDIEISPPAAALSQVVGDLKKCDVRILLAQATNEECIALAKQFPDFDLIVSGEDIDVPKAQPEEIPGSKTRLINVGHKGMYVVVAGFYDDPREPIRFQRVALDSRYHETKEMKALMASYQDQLEQLGWSGLGLKPARHPRTQNGGAAAGQFLGSASCKQCHPEAYEVWATSKHAHATETLVNADPPRQHDAECISCHATGWNAQEFYPYLTGFDSLAKTPLLAGNGCENCHGPGGAHVAAERDRNTAKRQAERDALKLTVETARDTVCIKCHDLDNSPKFFTDPAAYEKFYWPEIAH